MDATSWTIATTTYIALVVLSTLLALYVVYRLVLALVRAFLGFSGRLGGTFVARLIALGAVVFFFPSIIPALADSTMRIVNVVATRIPAGLQEEYAKSSGVCSPAAGGERVQAWDCVATLGFGGFRAWLVALDEGLRAALSPLPWTKIVLALAVWCLLLAVIRAAIDPVPAPAGTSGKTTLRSWLDGLGHAGRQDLLLFLILGLGSYLSIAAIAAIPGLQGDVAPEQVSAERLKERLQEALIKEEDFNRVFPTDAATRNPFESTKLRAREAMDKLPSTPPTSQNDSTAADWLRRSRLEFFNSEVTYLELRRDDVMTAWSTLRSGAWDAMTGAVGLALTTFEVGNVARKGGRETTEHFLSVDHWFRYQQSAHRGQLRLCLRDVGAMDQQLERWASQELTTIMSAPPGTLFSGPGTEAPYNVVYQARETCVFGSERASETATTVPDRPELGSHLGPFGLVARWLLRTESLALALITGLIGFGLVGSACATFIRERVKRGQAQAPGEEAAVRDATQRAPTEEVAPGRLERKPLVEDLAGVVIRGFSAAVVVFLAVEGGLAIFAADRPEPNPYVLLLTCLVAAVFSEDVWEWAHGKLRGQLRIEVKEPAPAGGEVAEARRAGTGESTRGTGGTGSEATGHSVAEPGRSDSSTSRDDVVSEGEAPRSGP